MPDKDGQVTTADFKAPEDQYRIMRESMVDGRLTIVADVYSWGDVTKIATSLALNDDDSIYTIHDDEDHEISFD